MRKFPALDSAGLAIFLLLTPFLAQADTSLRFSGEQAKTIYNYLTGSAVQNEGAAGHRYRIGKALTCRYTAADMSDSKGKDVPQEDPRRYVCGMKIDHEGFVSVSSNV